MSDNPAFDRWPAIYEQGFDNGLAKHGEGLSPYDDDTFEGAIWATGFWMGYEFRYPFYRRWSVRVLRSSVLKPKREGKFYSL